MAGRKRKETSDERRKRAGQVARRLARAVPAPRIELDFETPWQLLVATILAAQALDVTINRITPSLFARWPDPASLAAADPAEVEPVVRASGYYRNKTKAIQKVSAALVERHAGKVPRTMDELCALPGVARKTANVVLGAAFGVAGGIAIDTHVSRMAKRLALSAAHDPADIERDLCALFPKKSWIAVTQRLVLHGRYHCTARAPHCAACPVAELCPSAEAKPEAGWTQRADEEAARIARGPAGPAAARSATAESAG